MTSFPGLQSRPSHKNTREIRLGPFRWRGKVNLKDVTERVIAGVLSGTVAGTVAGLIVRFL